MKIEIEDASSIGQILGMVPKNSTVLEFGCSFGYMTKFMKEELNSKVSVVELDPNAFKVAMQYAIDGICCDVDMLEWVNYFEPNKFDVIIFADVFEHLRCPEIVLKNTKKLLKDDGYLLFSVPNIAHDDILSNLYCNQFQYTSLGLLDNTHIHFFAYKSLEPFAKSGGYSIIRKRYTYTPRLATEQAEFIPPDKRKMLETLFASHACGDVYQFVCKLQKKEYVEEKHIEQQSDLLKLNEQQIESIVYFDNGEGFQAGNSLTILKFVNSEQQYQYEIKVPDNTRAIRFDPMEREKCIVLGLQITVKDTMETVEETGSNGIFCFGSYIFDTTDPQIFIDFMGKKVECLYLKALIIPLRKNPWFEFISIIKESQVNYTKLLAIKEEQLNSVNLAKKNTENNLAIFENNLETCKSKLVVCEQQLTCTKEAYQQILNSTSWKATKPLRSFFGLLRKLFFIKK